MSIKIARSPAQFSQLLADYPKLVIFFFRQSSVPADILARYGDVARRIPSHQFAYIDVERSPVLSTVEYFASAQHGISVFYNHAHVKNFEGPGNEFYNKMDSLDAKMLEDMVRVVNTEGSAAMVGFYLQKLVDEQIRALKAEGVQKNITFNVSINLKVE
ncbi:hypothetical protein LPJ66_007831 [Kickxella alabastrina]|uniref:Uncharacterized protein n=1 Tax=Kickxella alabastrina TaxID=61397 RepID=A0ACC1IA40_9FUNG|nr:hypothetical protein LPJ66_007831 [Kickxella alabastrina]